MTSRMKTYTHKYLFEWLKVFHLQFASVMLTES